MQQMMMNQQNLGAGGAQHQQQHQQENLGRMQQINQTVTEMLRKRQETKKQHQYQNS